jgi:hypothetical protein
MERDALVVEIPVSSSKCDTANPKKIVRLCTTHLESLPEPEGKGAKAAPAGSNICIA